MGLRHTAVVGIALALAGCGSPEPEEVIPEAPLAQAWRAAQAEDHESAIVAYRLATEHEPERVDGWLGLAREQIRAGRPEDAVAAAQRAVELAPESADAHELLGLAQRVADPVEAAAELARAMEIDPTRVRDAFPRARALEAAGELAEARDAYLQSAEADVLRGRARAAAARVRMEGSELTAATLDEVEAELDSAEADAAEDPALAGAVAGLRRAVARARGEAVNGLAEEDAGEASATPGETSATPAARDLRRVLRGMRVNLMNPLAPAPTEARPLDEILDEAEGAGAPSGQRR